jgi:hypothetical protein
MQKLLLPQIKRKHSSSLTGSPKDKYAMDNSSKLKKMKNENNKFMPFLIILVPLVLMKLTLMIMKKISLSTK